MTTAVITQPTYLPWLGAFEAIARADVYVVLDTVQFQRRSWHSRNRLKAGNGEPFWLTVPVQRAPQQTPLAEILVADPAIDDWAAKHRRSIGLALAATPHAADAASCVQAALDDPPVRLVDLNVAIIEATAGALGLRPTWVRASELGVTGARSSLLTAICREVGADRYYSAAGSRGYMEEEQDVWDRSGLEVVFQEWEHPTYDQPGSAPFVSHLAALDPIANLGFGGAAAAIGSTAPDQEPCR
ncbi:MAG TPA: WbqC family protein [Acidimicrobiales bacterium]|nr:WbqC family protein [Acidimicrobiales bacterium]